MPFTLEANFTPTSTAPPPPASTTVGTVLLLQIEHGHEGDCAEALGTKDRKITARMGRRTCLEARAKGGRWDYLLRQFKIQNRHTNQTRERSNYADISKRVNPKVANKFTEVRNGCAVGVIGLPDQRATSLDVPRCVASLYPTYRKPFEVIFQKMKNEKWRVLGDDFRALRLWGRVWLQTRHAAKQIERSSTAPHSPKHCCRNSLRQLNPREPSPTPSSHVFGGMVHSDLDPGHSAAQNI